MKNKTNYLAGKYELIREKYHDSGNEDNPEIIQLDLTAAQAKTLMTNNLYDRLGFKSIELIQKKFDNDSHVPDNDSDHNY